LGKNRNFRRTIASFWLQKHESREGKYREGGGGKKRVLCAAYFCGCRVVASLGKEETGSSAMLGGVEGLAGGGR